MMLHHRLPDRKTSERNTRKPACFSLCCWQRTGHEWCDGVAAMSPGTAAGRVALFAFAFGYMSLGILLPLELLDEGFLTYGSWRVARGELPVEDFEIFYGPSIFFLGGGAFSIFGEDLAVLRMLLLTIKAVICVLVYMAARHVSGWLPSLGVFLILTALWGAPFPILTTIYPSFAGTVLCLGGFLAFLALRGRLLLACAVAGLLFGFATTFKQTAGAFGFLALALYLLTESAGPSRQPSAFLKGIVRTSRWAVLLIATSVAVIYLLPRNPAANFVFLIAPVLYCIALLARQEFRRPPEMGAQLQTFRAWVVLSSSFLLPTACWTAFYFSRGLGQTFLTVSGLPAVVSWIEPLPLGTTTGILWVVALASALGVRWLSTREAPGTPASRWGKRILGAASVAALGALVFYTRDGFDHGPWTLGLSDLWVLGPFVVVWFSLLEARHLIERDARTQLNPADQAYLAFTIFAAFALLSLYPAGEMWHGVAVAPIILPLFARILDRCGNASDQGPARNGALRFRAGLLVVLAVLAISISPVRDLLRNRTEPPASIRWLPRASEIGWLGDFPNQMRFRQIGRIIRRVHKESSPGQPVFVFSGAQLFYFLLNRPSPLQEYEFTLYLVAFGLIPDESARERVDEALVLERLREARPLLIDQPGSSFTENLRTAFPQVAQFLDANYQTVTKHGVYRVSRPRPTPVDAK
jgi:hypothetical protein